MSTPGQDHCEACARGDLHELTPTCNATRACGAVSADASSVILSGEEYAYLTGMRGDLEALKSGVLTLLALVTGARVPAGQVQAVVERLGGRVSSIVSSGG